MVRIDRIEHNVTIPEGVTATLSEDGVVTIAGPNGSFHELSNHLELRFFKMEADSSYERLATTQGQGIGRDWNAHLNNMVKGVTDGFTTTLKAFYSHFPMTLAVQGQNFVVNNYFGEKVPRSADILPGVDVKVSNKVEITVSGIDKELVGQTAAILSVYNSQEA